MGLLPTRTKHLLHAKTPHTTPAWKRAVRRTTLRPSTNDLGRMPERPQRPDESGRRRGSTRRQLGLDKGGEDIFTPPSLSRTENY
jgi:hypothetical protein